MYPFIYLVKSRAGATPANKAKGEISMKKDVYVMRPETTCYYGIKVTKDTKESFKNEHVKQTIENLVLKTEYKIKNDRFKSVTKTEIKLNEGEILLLEEENRGYFLPKDVAIGSIDEAIEDMMFLKEQISKIKE